MLNSDDLINKVKGYNKFLNPDRLNKAYDFAVKAHSNQKRASGDPYSVHPIEVANILTDLKLDSATITTGLLHDTIEDTYATYETIKGEFGDEVADLVDGVTKISALENNASSNSKAENFRKLILATSKDIRVLLVKIADRLHNMRTIKAISKEEKRKRISQETMEIYAPLADRMGMHRIRDELEDLSFEILNNEARSLIQKRLDEIKLDKKDIFETLSTEIRKLLDQNKISSKISSFSSVRESLKLFQLNFKKIHSDKKGIVVDGRDITTVIFPDAEIKFYVTASLKDRANRRFEELVLNNPKIDKKLVIKELQKRDQRDMERSVAPLKIAKDAIVIDTSDLTIEEVNIIVQREIEKVISKKE